MYGFVMDLYQLCLVNWLKACYLFLFAELEELITPLIMEKECLINELKKNNTHLYLAAAPGLEVQEALREGKCKDSTKQTSQML